MHSLALLYNRISTTIAARIPVRVRRAPRLVRVAVAGLVVLAACAVVLLGLTRLVGPRERFTTLSLPYVQDFREVDIKRWFSQNGLWAIRKEALVQTANPAPTSEQAAYLFLPYKIEPDTPYRLSMYITLPKNGRKAGVSFNAQYPQLTEKLHQVIISRSEDGSMALSAGYADKTDALIPQVTVPFTSTAQTYRLDVYVLSQTYFVQVNGQTLIEKRPLFHPNGLIGFYALGPATFDTLKLTVAETELPTDQVYVSDFDRTPSGAGWVPFGGEWQVLEGELAQVNPAALEAGIGYEGRAFSDFVLQATVRHRIGVGAGVLFNLPSPYQINGAHLVRYSDQTDALLWGYYDDHGVFTRQGFAEVEAPGEELHVIRLFVDNTAGNYDIFLDDRLVARAVPLQAIAPSAAGSVPAGHIGLITSRSSAAFSLVEVFPLFERPLGEAPKAAPKATPARRPATDAGAAFASPTSAPTRALAATPALRSNDPRIVSGDAFALQSDFRGDIARSDWKPISGRWRFQDGALVQTDVTGFDLSIVYVRNAFRNYAVEAAFRHREGYGGGVLFNMPYTDRLHSAHMVRFSDRRPGGVFWGYYDANGKFVGQGYGNAEALESAQYSLRVVCGATTYSIYLNDAVLAENVPLQTIADGKTQNFGYIGLIATKSAVIFDSVRVGHITTPTSASPARSTAQPVAQLLGGPEGFPNQRALNGEWVMDQGVYRQIVPNAADYLLSTGVAASNYTLEADVALPDKPEVGAGFVLHMTDRGRKNGAYMFRLVRGGSGVLWGIFDDSGVFRGRGSAELTPGKRESDRGRYRLKLIVRGNRMDAFVNQEQVAQDVPLPRAEGWIGLLAHGGPLTFENVRITTSPTP